MDAAQPESLLDVVSPDLPAGENLEYDPEFAALERTIAEPQERAVSNGELELEQVDWEAAEGLALALLVRTKDLRVAIHFARAALNLRGIPGLLQGLTVVEGLINRFWESVHPELDPDDNNDPTARINAINSLANTDTFLVEIRRSALFTSRTFGTVSYRDIAIANGEYSTPVESQDDGLGPSEIAAAFKECDIEILKRGSEAAEKVGELASAIELSVSQHVGVSNGPNLEQLVRCIGPIARTLRQKLIERGVDISDPSDVAVERGDLDQMTTSGQEAEGSTQSVAGGQVSNREDVIRAIDSICAYYTRHEPSSPIPLLLKRAKNLVYKDFIEVLRDLIPEAVSQAQQMCGADNSEGSE